MKRKFPWIRSAVALVLVAVVVLAVLQAGKAEQDTDKTDDTPDFTYELLKTQEFQPVAENGNYVLLTKSETAEIAVQCKQTGAVWYSNPQNRADDPIANGKYKNVLNCQLMIQYANKDKSINNANNFVGSVKKNTYSSRTIEDGIRYEFHFSGEGFVVPVEYVLCEDGLRVSVVNKDVQELKENRLLNYSVLPYFGCAEAGEEGYVVLPDGSGAIMDYKTSPADALKLNEYYADVYGRDPVYTLKAVQNNTKTVMIPTFGVCRMQGGMFAFVEQGDALSSLVAYPVNYVTSYANAYFEGTYRGIDEALLQEMTSGETSVMVLSETGVSLERYTVYYGFMEQAQPDYAALAGALRSYLLKNKLLNVTAQQTMPLYLELIGSVSGTETFLGVPYTTQVALTDYEEAAALLKRLKEAGIGNTVLNYMGWSNAAPYTTPITGKQLAGKLGGKSGFQQLLTTAEECGSTLLLSHDLQRLYQSGNGLSANTDAARNLSGGIMRGSQYFYSVYRKDMNGLQWTYLKNALLGDVAERYANGVVTLGANGTADLSVGSLLYSNYHKSMFKKQDSVDRQQAKEFSVAALSKMATAGTLLSYKGNAYAFAYVDGLADMPVTSSRYNSFTRDVPLLPLLLHGAVPYSGERLNVQSDDRDYLLRMVEYGACPFYAFADTSDKTLLNTSLEWLTSPNAEAWLDTVVADYEAVSRVYAPVLNAQMVGHEQVSDTLFVTTYEGGYRIAVNYGDTAVVYDGTNVPAKGFVGCA